MPGMCTPPTCTALSRLFLWTLVVTTSPPNIPPSCFYLSLVLPSALSGWFSCQPEPSFPPLCFSFTWTPLPHLSIKEQTKLMGVALTNHNGHQPVRILTMLGFTLLPPGQNLPSLQDPVQSYQRYGHSSLHSSHSLLWIPPAAIIWVPPINPS